MNSIFVRIYSGILVALLIIGAVTYAGVGLVNQYRSGLYRESMAHGTLYLMAQSYSWRPAGVSIEQWTHRLSRDLGAPVMLVGEDALSLSYRDRLYLDEGRVVFRPPGRRHPDTLQVIHALPDRSGYLSLRVSRLSGQQARATAGLVLAYLSRHPAAQQADALAALQPQFGYPLSLQPLAALALGGEQRRRLAAGETVFTLSDSSRHSAQVRLLTPLPDGRRLLVIGPMHLFDPYPWQLLLLVGVTALVLVALATYLQVRPLQTRLRRLGGAVKRLGSGDLTAHAPVSGNDPIGQVAETFNGMTTHIRRLIEAQRELTRAVSHELRTPVARLRFGLEMLADCESAEQRHIKLAELDCDIEELDNLIDEILTYARLEEGTPNIDFQPVQPRQLFEQLIKELDSIRGAIVIEAEGRSDGRLDGDPRYLHRVLQNLVTNALRYARSRVRMTVSEEDEHVILDVDDDGPGIPEHQRERVLKPFARLDRSRHRASGGYGLGLSIVKRIVDWHGGEIQVLESRWGGARFRVILPREQRARHALVRDRRSP